MSIQVLKISRGGNAVSKAIIGYVVEDKIIHIDCIESRLLI